MGWGQPPDGFYFNHLAAHLRDSGCAVQALPGANDGDVGKWVGELAAAVGEVDAGTYFIGQSVGNQVVLRYLGSLAEGARAGGFVAIAPWLNCDFTVSGDREGWWDGWFSDNADKLAPWCDESTQDFARVRSVCGNIACLMSDDDPVRGLDSSGEDNRRDWEGKVGARVAMQHGRGHFLHTELSAEELTVVDEALGLVAAE
eukprot:CAMPEP_0203821010 /NCGR_PEP_ID=MMETSP0115-20131106/41780_1 /ASSEMBLY_ACC=CAM_ASM_000227 /TAXON_ID=33651 /ORGANISM="Bicosoecid sp, Strain ms1" /LENGTH=200 /DNA_ID=CAMNT_0050730029 /DNA_START=1 /DNA_END=603 /DNA_ORIENTATION=+